MAKTKAKRKASKKSGKKKAASAVARTRTGCLVDVVTLRAAKVAAVEQGINVADVLGNWAKAGRP